MLARGRRKIDYLYLITDADAVADACAVAVAVLSKMGNKELKRDKSLLCCKGAIWRGNFLAVSNSVATWSNSPMFMDLCCRDLCCRDLCCRDLSCLNLISLA